MPAVGERLVEALRTNPAQMIDRQIARQREQPGVEIAACIKGTNLFDHFQPCLLNRSSASAGCRTMRSRYRYSRFWYRVIRSERAFRSPRRSRTTSASTATSPSSDSAVAPTILVIRMSAPKRRKRCSCWIGVARYLNHRNFRIIPRILHPFDVLARIPKVLKCRVQSAGAQLRSSIALP